MTRHKNPRCILITGATGGIGGALAPTYAAPGVTLILQGRRTERLEEMAEQCRAAGARVILHALDVQDLVAVREWISQISETEKPDLIIVGAGVNTATGPDLEDEVWELSQALIEVNVMAAIATVQAALPAMRARKHGQIALFSSLAGWRGLPVTPSYSASKAAIKAYGEAMRDLVAADGVRINVIMPGYVESKMCFEMPGPKPLLWTPDKAAQRIRRGLAADQARISFPFPLNLGCWALSVIPPRMSSVILRWLDYSA
ncbi:SDR family NAD(P)-dependent oxidoreductase [Pseudomonas frederiksbergensis]|uniref:SDR family NAD(P)-dependent oxidoreductase n=1 Tax=Pseudomonas frederiksbergensis TaxID=104087 RepID=UPI00197DF2F7|nr:SDR family NAD(P)-dependent oxidoreductase [Pseudomonas frederiksbergensis]MBN3865681.1 SDR family NAD(P)-dependent oxidoreductase [Pseudomonas frederiksbergensis]